MGLSTASFPTINSTLTIGWNDNNLRIGSVDWVINSPISIRVRIYRRDISPDPVYDQIHVGPETGSTNVPGNLRMQEVTDPLYPEEGTRIIWPDGLAFEFEVINGA